MANMGYKTFEERVLILALKLPVVGFYAKTRGWSFILAWIHRIGAVCMVLFLWAHIYTLSFLTHPEAYDAQMKLFGFVGVRFLEWLLALPVILHTLNGARLIIYEILGNRNDASAIRWVLGIAAIYVTLLGLCMTMGNQSVTPLFFWLSVSIVSVTFVFWISPRIWQAGGDRYWKLQRVSGMFMFMMIPAHLLFMHLQPSMGHDAGVIVARMQDPFIKAVDIGLVCVVLYHAGFGLGSICKDYIGIKALQRGCTALICLVMAVFAWIGIRLIVMV